MCSNVPKSVQWYLKLAAFKIIYMNTFLKDRFDFLIDNCSIKLIQQNIICYSKTNLNFR